MKNWNQKEESESFHAMIEESVPVTTEQKYEDLPIYEEEGKKVEPSESIVNTESQPTGTRKLSSSSQDNGINFFDSIPQNENNTKSMYPQLPHANTLSSATTGKTKPNVVPDDLF